jgi:hypothetical protein
LIATGRVWKAVGSPLVVESFCSIPRHKHPRVAAAAFLFPAGQQVRPRFSIVLLAIATPAWAGHRAQYCVVGGPCRVEAFGAGYDRRAATAARPEKLLASTQRWRRRPSLTGLSAQRLCR